MKDVRIKKAKLLSIIQKNRAEHRSIFLAAQKVYRSKVIEMLEEQLEAARELKPIAIQTIIALVAPSDHTADYDRAIQMLNLEVENVVTLSAADFSNLVQDQWSWSRDWAFSNSQYVDSPKFRSIE